MSDSENQHSASWITYANGRPRALHVRRCRLDVVAGPDTGLTKTFEDDVIRLGAGRGCQLTLSDRKVSGLHCEIRLERGGYRLRDLESTNGTFLLRHRVQDAFLNPGDLIELGHTKVRFEPLADSVEVALSEHDRFGELVGRSAAMRLLFARLEKLAAGDTTVLVTGPTGVGKELVALSLHEESARAKGRFEVVDCGSIPRNLAEAELFGHEKGAFTGALSSRAGAFERADGGTIFLDEIGELPLDLQPRLLRALEAREVRRVGGDRVIGFDVRVVAATNRDLVREIDAGRFRSDLYYRLAVATVDVPALRERKDDVPLLVSHLLAQLGGGASFAPATLDRLAAYDWPGNVRELRNAVETLVALGETAEVPAARAAARALPAGATGATGAHETLSVPVELDVPLKQAKQQLVDAFERAYVSRLLEVHGGNVSAVARDAGMDRMSVHKIMQKLGLTAKK